MKLYKVEVTRHHSIEWPNSVERVTVEDGCNPYVEAIIKCGLVYLSTEVPRELAWKAVGEQSREYFYDKEMDGHYVIWCELNADDGDNVGIAPCEIFDDEDDGSGLKNPREPKCDKHDCYWIKVEEEKFDINALQKMKKQSLINLILELKEEISDDAFAKVISSKEW